MDGIANPPLILFFIIKSMSTSVKRSNSTFVFFKAACHARPGADINLIGSNS